MNRHPRLNFPSFPFRIVRRAGVPYVWDEMRGRWLLLTPEEWVRRHLVRFLVERLGADRHYVVQEYPVDRQGQPQRADVVVLAPGGACREGTETCGGRPEPLLLAECKAADVPIDDAVLAQAVRYNSRVGARFLLLTNGMKHYCYEADGKGGYRTLSSLPDLGAYCRPPFFPE